MRSPVPASLSEYAKYTTRRDSREFGKSERNGTTDCSRRGRHPDLRLMDWFRRSIQRTIRFISHPPTCSSALGEMVSSIFEHSSNVPVLQL